MAPDNQPESESISESLIRRLPDKRIVLVGSGAGVAGDVFTNLLTEAILELATHLPSILNDRVQANDALALLAAAGWLIAIPLVVYALYHRNPASNQPSRDEDSQETRTRDGAAGLWTKIAAFLRTARRYRRPFVVGVVAATLVGVLLVLGLDVVTGFGPPSAGGTPTPTPGGTPTATSDTPGSMTAVANFGQSVPVLPVLILVGIAGSMYVDAAQ